MCDVQKCLMSQHSHLHLLLANYIRQCKYYLENAQQRVKERTQVCA